MFVQQLRFCRELLLASQGRNWLCREGVVMGTPAPVQDCSRMGSSEGQDGQALCAASVFSHLLERLGALGVTGVSGSRDFHDVSTRIRALICPMGESECMEEIWNHVGSAHATEVGLVLTLGVVLLHPYSMLPGSGGISGLRSGPGACNWPLVPVPVGVAMDRDGCVACKSQIGLLEGDMWFPMGTWSWRWSPPYPFFIQLGLGVLLGWRAQHIHLTEPRSLSPHQAYLRAVDVKILQQLVAVNEGIEAVKWLLEEKSTLTSRCSSLASSQYSLAGSQTASRRGSWDSLQDPPDKLDSISIGSYLDTLADDMDEYSQNAAELPRALGRAEQDWGRLDPERGFTKQEKGRAEHEWPHADLSPDRSCPDLQRFAKEPQVANGYSGKEPKLGPGERLEKGNVGGKARKAEANLENCKLNSELHLEYDAHWLWLQSQDDVTFL